MRSALVFPPEEFALFKRLVEVGRQFSDGNKALVTFNGNPLKVSTCHKMWTTLFLKAGKDFASYPKKITYSLFRAQARKGLFISMTI